MRLDHLLSTEFFRTPVGVRSVARMPERVFGGCGRAGVEEIMGFAGSRWGPAGSGMGMLLGSRTATRDVWSRAVFRMPLAGRRWPVGLRAGSCRGAWWFENWIVDASNAMIVFIVCFIAISPGSFLESGFEIDRFVIIFYSVMICRLAWRAIIRFFGACAALKGVWWMPWQTVPMKDV